MSYRYLLIPGRHQAITSFQIRHLKELQGSRTARNADVVWAITSANHGGTQRNPVSGRRRLGMIEAVTTAADVPSMTFEITNMTPKDNFAHYVLEDIRLASKGRVAMTPANTLVVCSTKSVADQYRSLGYAIDTAEADATMESIHTPVPWSVVEEIVRSGAGWRSSAIVQGELHPACLEYYERYGLGDDIVDIFQDPLIDSDDGDITATRDYATYRQAFEGGAQRKVNDFKSFVQPGKILDVGCATGETLKLLSQEPTLFESDFYGVEAARPLFQICNQRKEAGEFGDANVFFYQRNIMRSSLFAHNTLDTIITMALTHEIESYLGRSELESFLQRMYDITAPGGTYINYDVVAPDDKDRIVHVLLAEDDGDNPTDVHPKLDAGELPDFLSLLSTRARFRRFVDDFRAAEHDQISVDYETIDGLTYVVLRYADLCDFLAKKDYNDSWTSEMHERFCYWNYADWTSALQRVGFTIADGSHAIQNPWLIENRFKPAAKVYTNEAGALRPVEQPVTNLLLVATKPAA